MNLGDSIGRIRRMVRDKGGIVFSDSQIIRIWNEMQYRFAADTDILEEEVILPVPALIQMTYTYRWEDEFSGSPSNFLYSFIDDHTYTQPWEPISLRPITPTIDGGITSTQSWESFYAEIQNRLVHYFPSDYITYSFVAYDEKPIDSQDRKKLDSGNEQFMTKTGVYPILYVDDYSSGIFYLYPKVTSVYGGKEIDSDYGIIGYDEDGNINPDSDYGVIIYSSSDNLNSNYGVVADYNLPANNLTLIYSRIPNKVSEDIDESQLPSWCHKYIEYSVLERLFRMETDIQNLMLSKHFGDRYQAGLRLVEEYKSNCRTMRVYRLEQENHKTNYRKRLADLPSHYPSYWR